MGGQRKIGGALNVEDAKTTTGSPTRPEFLKAASQ
jgi:hypothetical protein